MKCTADSLRYNNVNNNVTYTSQINSWVNEAVSLYGVQIDYWVYDYNLMRHDALYGQDVAAEYRGPYSMIALVQVQSELLRLSNYGLQTTAECEIYIPFDTFAQAVGDAKAFPKAEDLVRLTESGLSRPGGGGYPFRYGDCRCDGVSGETGTSGVSGILDCGWLTGAESTTLVCDPDLNEQTNENPVTSISRECICNPVSGWIRGPKVYEITQVLDDSIPEGLNPLQSHTYWKVEAIRFDYSYQPGAPFEIGSNMVNDSPYYGKLPGGTENPAAEKQYPQTVEKETLLYWDYDKYGLDVTYGDYGAAPLTSGGVTYDPSKDPYSSKYYVVWDEIPMLDNMPIGTTFYYYFGIADGEKHLRVANEEEIEKILSSGQSIGYYLLRDTGDCVKEFRLYALYVYSGAIAISYIGGRVKADQTVYTNMIFKDTITSEITRLYIQNGEIKIVKASEVEQEEAAAPPEIRAIPPTHNNFTVPTADEYLNRMDFTYF